MTDLCEESSICNHNDDLQRCTLHINVGGRSAFIPDSLLKNRNKGGRLAEFSSMSHSERLLECDAYFDASNEYYFERSSDLFEYIIDFYVNGILHRPMDICPVRIKRELEFWRIPLTMLSQCCKLDSNRGQLQQSQYSINSYLWDEQFVDPASVHFKDVCFGEYRLKAWNFLEYPQSSTGAKLMSLISASFVMLSLAVLILTSMPEFQKEDQEPHWVLTYLENSCMFWFTLEYVIRFLVTATKLRFFKSALNIIDVLTIIPFYIEMLLPYAGIMNTSEIRNLRGAMIVVRLTRLARVTRIFKLARYSIGLRAFGQTMRKSAAELSMLGMFLLTGIMLFSTTIYFFERDEPGTKFFSIPAACWWCVITMTTVGYGDLVPLTPGGKVVAALASICGIIVLAFPISMIIDKFAESTSACSGEHVYDDHGAEKEKRRKHGVLL